MPDGHRPGFLEWLIKIKEGGMKYITVRYLDPQGLSRAWASGPLNDKKAIHQLASKQLSLYRDEKRNTNDPLATARFTVEELITNLEEGG